MGRAGPGRAEYFEISWAGPGRAEKLRKCDGPGRDESHDMCPLNGPLRHSHEAANIF